MTTAKSDTGAAPIRMAAFVFAAAAADCDACEDAAGVAPPAIGPVLVAVIVTVPVVVTEEDGSSSV